MRPSSSLLLMLGTPSAVAAAGRPRTFGKGIPNHPFTDVEVEIFNHSLPRTSTVGMVTHFWSTACGAGVSFKGGLDSGVTTYRYYIDGEAEASVTFTPREAAGVVFDPIGECNDPECTHAAPHGGGGGGGKKSAGNITRRLDEYLVGGRGETCTSACASAGKQCNPLLVPPGLPEQELGQLFSDLLEYDTGATCTADSQPWWAPDQPSYVWAKNNSNYGRCVGVTGIPPPGVTKGGHTSSCDGEHPLVQRLCRCQRKHPTGMHPDKAALLYPPPAAATTTTAQYGYPEEPSGLDLVSAKVPWGTEWVGKTSDMDGYYTNMRVPFYKSLRVTAQLPHGHRPFSVYTIIRGQENVPLTIGGADLSAEKPKLKTYHNQGVPKASLEFTAIVNKTQGAGVIWGHTLGIEGHDSFTYLEGCFHLLTPWVAPAPGSGAAGLGLSANFPGTTLSTGMEDYYDSSFYFHAGIFQLPVSGVTHMCAGGGKHPAPHPACPMEINGSGSGGVVPAYPARSKWSAYRFHEKDPLWFEGGVQLLVRNGDVDAAVPYGSAKCYNLDMKGGPGPSVVTSTAWVYEFAE